jgi:hypothetical protein
MTANKPLQPTAVSDGWTNIWGQSRNPNNFYSDPELFVKEHNEYH